MLNGNRPSNDVYASNGAYDGTYVRDFEFVKDSCDLDQTNGRFGVTPEFPDGTYYYVITDSFPSIPRYFAGTPSDDFKTGGGREVGREGRGPRPSTKQIMQMMDANNDSKLSKEEVQGPLKNDFDNLDKNKDGYLTKDELEH